MKISGVKANNRKRLFEVRTRGREYAFPYSRTQPAVADGDRVCEVRVDAELGREGFTYSLTSGLEGSVHVDAVLEYNEDPSTLANLLLYRLSMRARQELDDSSLSAREVARRLGTSASQLYRLLDPANESKSLSQLLALLHVLGCRVDVAVTSPAPREAAG